MNVRKRISPAIAALVLAALGVLLWIGLSPGIREPVYQGKTLHYWLSDFWPGRNPTPEKREQDKFAVRQIGTNAIPILLHWISARDGFLKRKMISLIHDHPRIPIRFETAVDKNMLAVSGFWILGKSQASSAVPALVEIVRTGGGARSGPNDVTFPMMALANLDPEAAINVGIQLGTNRWSGTNLTAIGWRAPPAAAHR